MPRCVVCAIQEDMLQPRTTEISGCIPSYQTKAQYVCVQIGDLLSSVAERQRGNQIEGGASDTAQVVPAFLWFVMYFLTHTTVAFVVLVQPSTSLPPSETPRRATEQDDSAADILFSTEHIPVVPAIYIDLCPRGSTHSLAEGH